MKKIFFLSLIFTLIIAFQLCGDNAITDSSKKSIRDLTEIETAIIDADNVFGIKLFQTIVADTSGTNIFISPLSISMALGMTLNGSNGTTYTAMKSTLEYGELTNDEINQSYQNIIDILTDLDHKVDFQIANSIWCREDFPVEEDFISVNQDYFDAMVSNLDFSRDDAADIINAWVAENTNGKIKEIVTPPIDAFTIMFLINAIYFNGSWTYEFDEDNTETAPFYLLGGSQTTCQMMSHKNEHLYTNNRSFQAVDLPYGDGNFRMMIILPYEDVSIDSLIQQMDSDTWQFWLSQCTNTEINLYLPKFKLEYDQELKKALSHLGMSIAFDCDHADFSRINPDWQLFISKVKHKTFIDVNEEGTEAAAVTSVEISLTSAGGDDGIPTMRINRPFIFAIHEVESGTILFLGKIIKPEYSD